MKNDYTIFSYNENTKEWGWVGTQTLENPEEEFLDILDLPKDTWQVSYTAVVLQLPPTFLNGKRVKAMRMDMKTSPCWYWVENTNGIIVASDYDGPVEPLDIPPTP